MRLVGPWQAFARALDPDAFRQRLDGQLRRAHARIGRRFVVTARKAINAKNYTPNSAVTVLMKGIDKPLVDSGELLGEIDYDVRDDARRQGVHVGLIRAKSGQELVDRATFLHDGATLHTDDGSIVRIPARPFLLEPLNDPAFVRFVRETWSDAVRSSLFPPGRR